MNDQDASAPVTTLTILGTIVAMLGLLVAGDLAQVALGLAAVAVAEAVHRAEPSPRARLARTPAPVASQVASKTRGDDGTNSTSLDKEPR